MITFDQSLLAFAQLLSSHELDISRDAGVFVRDLRGRLLFVSRRELTPELFEKLDQLIHADLRPYVSPLGAIADKTTPGSGYALSDKNEIHLDVPVSKSQKPIVVALLDRRAMGADWMHAPDDPGQSPPKLVFTSLKGGVGRSTALSVLAADLAEKGYSVLVVDLDLEAPGLGSMLVEASVTPKFGTLDFYVEHILQELDDAFFIDCLAPSWLGGGRGRIDVAPAFGALSLQSPHDVLGKLSRAYLESEDREGRQQTFLTRTQTLVNRLSLVRRYDAVLIDTRAGLHETTAAAMLGLGADVLLFGVDQPQTLSGYGILLSHLARLPVSNANLDWRYRLRMIQAKVTSAEAAASYSVEAFDLFDRVFYSNDGDADPLMQAFRFNMNDSDAPHSPIVIFEDERYRLFDPVKHRGQLAAELYQQSFGAFLQFCVERLQLGEGAKP